MKRFLWHCIAAWMKCSSARSSVPHLPSVAKPLSCRNNSPLVLSIYLPETYPKSLAKFKSKATRSRIWTFLGNKVQSSLTSMIEQACAWVRCLVVFGNTNGRLLFQRMLSVFPIARIHRASRLSQWFLPLSAWSLPLRSVWKVRRQAWQRQRCAPQFLPKKI